MGFLFLILYPVLLSSSSPRFVNTHFVNTTLSTHTLSTHTLCQHTLCKHTLCQHTLCQHTLCQHTLCHTHFVNTPFVNTLFVNTLCQHTLCQHHLSHALCQHTLCVTGRRSTISHPPSFCVAGVALMALSGALRLGLVVRDARGPRHFAWQAWRNLTSTFVLRGRRGAISHLPSFCLACVAQLHVHLRGRHGTHGTQWRAWTWFSRP